MATKTIAMEGPGKTTRNQGGRRGFPRRLRSRSFQPRRAAPWLKCVQSINRVATKARPRAPADGTRGVERVGETEKDLVDYIGAEATLGTPGVDLELVGTAECCRSCPKIQCGIVILFLKPGQC